MEVFVQELHTLISKSNNSRIPLSEVGEVLNANPRARKEWDAVKKTKGVKKLSTYVVSQASSWGLSFSPLGKGFLSVASPHPSSSLPSSSAPASPNSAGSGPRGGAKSGERNTAPNVASTASASSSSSFSDPNTPTAASRAALRSVLPSGATPAEVTAKLGLAPGNALPSSLSPLAGHFRLFACLACFEASNFLNPVSPNGACPACNTPEPGTMLLAARANPGTPPSMLSWLPVRPRPASSARYAPCAAIGSPDHDMVACPAAHSLAELSEWNWDRQTAVEQKQAWYVLHAGSSAVPVCMTCLTAHGVAVILPDDYDPTAIACPRSAAPDVAPHPWIPIEGPARIDPPPPLYPRAALPKLEDDLLLGLPDGANAPAAHDVTQISLDDINAFLTWLERQPVDPSTSLVSLNESVYRPLLHNVLILDELALRDPRPVTAIPEPDGRTLVLWDVPAVDVSRCQSAMSSPAASPTVTLISADPNSALRLVGSILSADISSRTVTLVMPSALPTEGLPPVLLAAFPVSVVDTLQYTLMHHAIEHVPLETVFPLMPMPESGHEPDVAIVDKCLTEVQRQVISRVLLPDPIPTLLEGPFGAGKTRTIKETLHHLLKEPTSRILICTHTNSAADIYAGAFAEASWPDNTVYRLMGSMRNPGSVPGSIRRYTSPSPTGSGYTRDGKLTPHYITHDVDTLAKFKVVVATTVTAGNLSLLNLPPRFFTHIIIDEAAQVSEPELAIPLLLATPGHTHLVLVSDHMQMDARTNVATSLRFGYSPRLVNLTSCSLPRRLSMSASLSVHRIHFFQVFRSHPHIVNALAPIYGGQICAAPGAASGLASPDMFIDENWPRLYFLPAPPAESIATALSALVVTVKSYPRLLSNAAVITPSLAMARELRNALRSSPVSSKLTVLPLDNVQGLEFDVVFLLTDGVSVDRTARLIHQPRRMNTAISRARNVVVTIGNTPEILEDPSWHMYARTCGYGMDNYSHFLEMLDKRSVLVDAPSKISKLISLLDETMSVLDVFSGDTEWTNTFFAPAKALAVSLPFVQDILAMELSTAAMEAGDQPDHSAPVGPGGAEPTLTFSDKLKVPAPVSVGFAPTMGLGMPSTASTSAPTPSATTTTTATATNNNNNNNNNAPGKRGGAGKKKKGRPSKVSTPKKSAGGARQHVMRAATPPAASPRSIAGPPGFNSKKSAKTSSSSASSSSSSSSASSSSASASAASIPPGFAAPTPMSGRAPRSPAGSGSGVVEPQARGGVAAAAGPAAQSSTELTPLPPKLAGACGVLVTDYCNSLGVDTVSLLAPETKTFSADALAEASMAVSSVGTDVLRARMEASARTFGMSTGLPLCFTVDSPRCSDPDDAFTLTPMAQDESGTRLTRVRLGIHIADVAELVGESKTPTLDGEVRARASTLYIHLPDGSKARRPLFPTAIERASCLFADGAPKLTLSLAIDLGLDPSSGVWKVLSHEFIETAWIVNNNFTPEKFTTLPFYVLYKEIADSLRIARLENVEGGVVTPSYEVEYERGASRPTPVFRDTGSDPVSSVVDELMVTYNSMAGAALKMAASEKQPVLLRVQRPPAVQKLDAALTRFERLAASAPDGSDVARALDGLSSFRSTVELESSLSGNGSGGRSRKKKGWQKIRKASVPKHPLRAVRSPVVRAAFSEAFPPFSAEYAVVTALSENTTHIDLQVISYAHATSPVGRYVDLLAQAQLKTYVLGSTTSAFTRISKSVVGTLAPRTALLSDSRQKLERNLLLASLRSAPRVFTGQVLQISKSSVLVFVPELAWAWPNQNGKLPGVWIPTHVLGSGAQKAAYSSSILSPSKAAAASGLTLTAADGASIQVVPFETRLPILVSAREETGAGASSSAGATRFTPVVLSLWLDEEKTYPGGCLVCDGTPSPWDFAMGGQVSQSTGAGAGDASAGASSSSGGKQKGGGKKGGGKKGGGKKKGGKNGLAGGAGTPGNRVEDMRSAVLNQALSGIGEGDRVLRRDVEIVWESGTGGRVMEGSLTIPFNPPQPLPMPEQLFVCARSECGVVHGRVRDISYGEEGVATLSFVCLADAVPARVENMVEYALHVEILVIKRRFAVTMCLLDQVAAGTLEESSPVVKELMDGKVEVGSGKGKGVGFETPRMVVGGLEASGLAGSAKSLTEYVHAVLGAEEGKTVLITSASRDYLVAAVEELRGESIPFVSAFPDATYWTEGSGLHRMLRLRARLNNEPIPAPDNSVALRSPGSRPPSSIDRLVYKDGVAGKPLAEMEQAGRNVAGRAAAQNLVPGYFELWKRAAKTVVSNARVVVGPLAAAAPDSLLSSALGGVDLVLVVASSADLSKRELYSTLLLPCSVAGVGVVVYRFI